jgi:importin-4
MTPVMGQVWPIIEAGLHDPDATVRKATCTAISCFCEWLEDECIAKHAALVPVRLSAFVRGRLCSRTFYYAQTLMTLVDDPLTQRAACTALDALLEILHDSIDQYLQLIMERLAGLLDTAPIAVKSVVTGAIGSAAHASKQKFLPYFQPTMNRLQHFLVLTGEGEETELRGITMDAIGTFAEAVGKDVFRPYFNDMMKQAFQGIEIGTPRLKECSFLFFSVIARVFGDEFAPYLPNVVPPLLDSCRQSETGEDFAQADVSDASAFASGTSPANAIAVGDAVEDVDIEGVALEKMLDVSSAMAVEKEIAADTLGTLFIATKTHFLPYVQQSTLELIGLLPHYYEGIRKSATISLLEIVRTFYDLSDPEEWQPGATLVSDQIWPFRSVNAHLLFSFLFLVGCAFETRCKDAHWPLSTRPY